eukprot:3512810-Rhodomonas_salina.1
MESETSFADAQLLPQVTVEVFTKAGSKSVGKISVPVKSIVYREYMDDKFKLPQHHDGTTPT